MIEAGGKRKPFLLHQRFRNSLQAAFAVNYCKRHGGLDEQRAITMDLVLVNDFGGCDLLDPCGQLNFIIVFCWQLVAAIDACDDDEPARRLDVAIPSAGGSKKLGATDFKIREVIRVMNKTTRVAFVVANS